MKTLTERIVDTLRDQRICYEIAGAAASRRVEERWTRIWPYNSFDQMKKYAAADKPWFRWHPFGLGLLPCLRGPAAMAAYQESPLAPFFIFDDDMIFCAKCHGDHFPDLSVLKEDLYVVEGCLRWTMAFSHDQPKRGPYFAKNLSDIE